MLSFGQEKRLRKRWQYARLRGRSQAARFSECIIYRIPNELGHFRLGITVRPRCGSILRNRIKREIREMFRGHSQGIPGFDFNVVIPQQVETAHPYVFRLRKDLQRFFSMNGWTE